MLNELFGSFTGLLSLGIIVMMLVAMVIGVGLMIKKIMS